MSPQGNGITKIIGKYMKDTMPKYPIFCKNLNKKAWGENNQGYSGYDLCSECGKPVTFNHQIYKV